MSSLIGFYFYLLRNRKVWWKLGRRKKDWNEETARARLTTHIIFFWRVRFSLWTERMDVPRSFLDWRYCFLFFFLVLFSLATKFWLPFDAALLFYFVLFSFWKLFVLVLQRFLSVSLSLSFFKSYYMPNQRVRKCNDEPFLRDSALWLFSRFLIKWNSFGWGIVFDSHLFFPSTPRLLYLLPSRFCCFVSRPFVSQNVLVSFLSLVVVLRI